MDILLILLGLGLLSTVLLLLGYGLYRAGISNQNSNSEGLHEQTGKE